MAPAVAAIMERFNGKLVRSITPSTPPRGDRRLAMEREARIAEDEIEVLRHLRRLTTAPTLSAIAASKRNV